MRRAQSKRDDTIADAVEKEIVEEIGKKERGSDRERGIEKERVRERGGQGA